MPHSYLGRVCQSCNCGQRYLLRHHKGTFLLSLVAQYSCTILNCSNPDTPSLLEALSPVFNLNAIRPVMNITTVTNVGLFLIVMDENTAPNVPYTYMHSDGTVSDSQPIKAVTSCRLDIYLFPFDIQNCTLTFNSFTLKSKFMRIYHKRMFEYSKSMTATMGEWELIGITAKKYTLPSTASGFYDEIRFHISLRRQAMLYVVNLLLPSCFLITVDLFSFILPPKEVDRSLFKMTLILGYTVFLLIMNDLLPVTGNDIPLISAFTLSGLVYISLLETIVVTSFLHGSSNYSRAPRWIRVLFLKILGRLTLEQKGPLGEDKTLQELRSLGRVLQAIRLQVEQHLSKSLSTEEWIQIGLIIDRLLFILYIIFITVSFITIIIIWVVSYNAA
uniref:5-hydroxytryptamine receptor 3A-like n=1 Tax=Neolamprologus brichardi TaxID=32507 RepID=A0A3Q4G3L4_NEOBR